MTGPAQTRGLALLIAGDHLGALAEFETLRDRRPRDPGVHLVLGLIQTELGDLPAARCSYLRALGLNRSHITALYNLALVSLRLGQRPRAATLLRRVLRLAPNHPGAALGLARLYLELQDWRAAESLLADLLSRNPLSLTVLTLFGQARLARGDAAGAARVFAEALRLNPAADDIRALLQESLASVPGPNQSPI